MPHNTPKLAILLAGVHNLRFRVLIAEAAACEPLSTMPGRIAAILPAVAVVVAIVLRP